MKRINSGKSGAGYSRRLLKGLFWALMLAMQIMLCEGVIFAGEAWAPRAWYGIVLLGFAAARLIALAKARGLRFWRRPPPDSARAAAPIPMGWVMFWLLCALLTFHGDSISWELYAAYSFAAAANFVGYAYALALDRARDKRYISKLEGERDAARDE